MKKYTILQLIAALCLLLGGCQDVETVVPDVAAVGISSITATFEDGSGNFKGIVEEGKVYEKGFSYVEMPMGTVHVFLREGYLFPVARGGKCVEDVDFEDLKMYSFGEEIKPYEYYLDDGETKDFTIESHIRMLSC